MKRHTNIHTSIYINITKPVLDIITKHITQRVQKTTGQSQVKSMNICIHSIDMQENRLYRYIGPASCKLNCHLHWILYSERRLTTFYSSSFRLQMLLFFLYFKFLYVKEFCPSYNFIRSHQPWSSLGSFTTHFIFQ